MPELNTQALDFEWDVGNQSKNWLKHKITTKDCEEIFINEPLLITEDLKHSDNEERFLALGQSNILKKLSVTFTWRGSSIRVISARPMSKMEKKIYEKVKTNT